MANRADFPIWESVKIRWSDMDSMGHVNNARYFTYLESARIALFSTLGPPVLSEDKRGFALVHTACNFRQQLHYPGTIEIGTRVTKIGNSSFQLEHGFYRQQEETLVADAVSAIAWVNYGEGKSEPLPEVVREGLQKYL
jgi:acyl-CoA thioester hydrolase